MQGTIPTAETPTRTAVVEAARVLATALRVQYFFSVSTGVRVKEGILPQSSTKHGADADISELNEASARCADQIVHCV